MPAGHTMSDIRPSPRGDRDGVRIEARDGVRGGVWLLVVAIGLVALALLLFLRPWLSPTPTAAPAAPPRERLAVGADAAPRQPPPVPEARQPPRPQPPDAVRPPDVPPLPAGGAEVEPQNPNNPVFSEAKPGEKSGIQLFPPPGTKPIKVGILVPDDFELPPGYVRHYQATDDGERVPAILMFHPDFHPVDADGRPIELPENRVVPPELAPPGLPIVLLDPPPEPDADNPEVPAP